MPRLTLRTLLAYIDDTLEPNETRSLGKKVAESDDARQLVERIKRVTRRRGLATPDATNDDATADPNTVAEYLDNCLDSATLKQVEETCLGSDVHLAEVAACHQILTLVLTEPVRVPPRAHRRMYGLVEAPASVPGRRPNKALAPIGGAAPPTEAQADADDADAALLLGLKRYSAATTWAARFALLGVATVLLLLLTGAALLSLPGAGPKPPEASAGNSYALFTQAPAVAVPAEPKPKDKEPVKLPVGDVPPPKAPEPALTAELAAEAAMAGALAAELAAKKPVEPVEPPPQVAAARIEVRPLARVETPNQFVVVRAADEWLRLKALTPDEREIPSNTPVMALPGYKANVLVDGKVQVHLWGNVPEQMQYRVLESRVKFHVAQEGFDADITLQAGRIYLKSKQPAGSKVRVRLATEVWDVTLPDAETSVLVELISWFAPGTPYAREGGERPKQEARAAVVFGSAGFAAPARFKKFEKVAKDQQIVWDSKSGTLSDPKPIENPQESARDPVLEGEFHTQLRKVLSGMAEAVSDAKKPGAVVPGRLDPAPNVPSRDLVARIAVYAQTAMADGAEAPNMLKALVDEFGKTDPWYTRQAVVTALVHWLPRDPANTAALHAVLVDKGAIAIEADLVLTLLRGYISPTQPNEERLDDLVGWLDERTTKLSSPAVGVWVREVALWNLLAVDQSRWVPALVLDKAWISGAAVKSNEYQAFLTGWRERVAVIKKREVPKK